MVTSLDIVIDHQNRVGRLTHVLDLAVAVLELVNALVIAGAMTADTCGPSPNTLANTVAAMVKANGID